MVAHSKQLKAVSAGSSTGGSQHAQVEQLHVPLQLIDNNEDLLHTFHRLDDAMEVLFVLDGIKPAARQMVHEQDFHKIAEFCEQHQLKYAVSSFKILKDRKLMVKPWVEEPGYYFVYLSLSQDDANKAKFYEELRNDEKLGEFLGYPSCCVRFYKEHYATAARRRDDYSLLSIANTELKEDPEQKGKTTFPSFLTNNMLRHFGLSLISHFPCSYHCVPTVFLAKRCFESVSRRNPLLATYLREVLRGPVLSHEETGIHALKGYRIEPDILGGNHISYNQVWLTAPNELHDKLAISNKIEMVGKHHVRIFNNHHLVEELKGDAVGMMIFE